MRKFQIAVAAFLLIAVGCSKEDEPTPGEKTAFNAADYGQLFVYRMDLCSDGATTISIDGAPIGDFEYAYTEERDCFEHNDPRAGRIISRPTGKYLISGRTSGGTHIWAQSVQLFQGQCRYIGLRCNGVVVGDGIYNPTGTWTFWVDQATCGEESAVGIEITGPNYSNSGTISPAFESEIDCLNTLQLGLMLEMPVGNYAGHAEELTGQLRTWDFNFTVGENDCSTFRLYCQ